MQSGGKHLIKPERTKFRQNQEFETMKQNTKRKKKDKSAWRLIKEEKQYVV